MTKVIRISDDIYESLLSISKYEEKSIREIADSILRDYLELLDTLSDQMKKIEFDENGTNQIRS